MKKILSLLSLAGLLFATGCAVNDGYGGYYGPTEFSVGVYNRPYYYQDGHYYHRGYWDRGRYYRY